jgi:hypothetical protein
MGQGRAVITAILQITLWKPNEIEYPPDNAGAAALTWDGSGT